MQKWEISFVWRPPQSWPGTACRKVRETRHLVTRHGGSWFQTVGGELCRRGQHGVQCVFSAGLEGIPSDKPRLYFFTEGRKVGVGSMCGRENV